MKVGDKVRVIDTCIYDSHNGIYIGAVGEVVILSSAYAWVHFKDNRINRNPEDKSYYSNELRAYLMTNDQIRLLPKGRK